MASPSPGEASSAAGGARAGRPEPPGEPLVPHGMSVVVNAPAVFRFTADACPERHLAAAGWLGADVGGAAPNDAGEILARHLVALMQRTGIPNGCGGVGYSASDAAALATGAWAQQRLIRNAPKPVDEATLGRLFANAMRYW